MVVDLERKMFVTRTDKHLAHGCGSFANWQCPPIFCTGARNQPIKMVLSSKNGAEGQSPLHRSRDGSNEHDQNSNFPNPHHVAKRMRNVSAIKSNSLNPVTSIQFSFCRSKRRFS